MTKIQKISKSITPVAGVFYANDEYKRCGLRKHIDSQLGTRISTKGYLIDNFFGPLLTNRLNCYIFAVYFLIILQLKPNLFMAIHYVIRKKANPIKPDIEPSYYMIQKSLGMISTEQLVEHMVQNSSLTEMEALTGIHYLTKSLTHFLSMGFTVQLGDLGYFKITMKSKGSPKEEDVIAGKLTAIKLHFYVSEAMRKMVRGFHISRFKKKARKPKELPGSELSVSPVQP